MIKIQFEAMGCAMAAFLDTAGSEAARALEQVPAWFEEWEQVLSRFREDSDLSRLNRETGLTVEAHPVFLEVIQAALDAAELTAGLVTPTLLANLEQAGYSRSFDRIHMSGAVPGDFLATTGTVLAPDATDWRLIRVDTTQGLIQRPSGMRLDLGGIGKGWAARQAMLRLAPFGPALVDAGGDLAVSGPMADGTGWPVAIEDPLQVHERLELLLLSGGGVATSGRDYRRWTREGRGMHHIIDPRSGEPAQTDLISVTIVAPDVLQAEAAAKAVLILGNDEGQAWLEAHPDLGGLLALQDGRVHLVGLIDAHLWRG